MELAEAIGTEDNMLADISHLFGVKHSCLWDKRTGEDEIRKLLIEYGVVRESNAILNASAHSLPETYKDWCDRLKFIGVSHESLRKRCPDLTEVLNTLLKIYKKEDILPEQIKAFHSELVKYGAEIKDLLLNDQVFADIYKPYLGDLSDDDIADIRAKLEVELFALPAPDCSTKVKTAADNFRNSQLKSQLSRLWKDKTETNNPREWSKKYRTPILCCVPKADYENAKRAFETLNYKGGADSATKSSLDFLNSTTTLFDVLMSSENRDAAFGRNIVGVYIALLPNLDAVRDELERLPIDIYDWHDDPRIKDEVELLANTEYDASGRDKVLQKIKKMDDTQLRRYLECIVKDNIAIGIEILKQEEETECQSTQ